MKESRHATSSPMRFERAFGLYIVTCMNVADKNTGEHICSMVQGGGRSWKEAKAELYADCRELGIFLTPRSDIKF